MKLNFSGLARTVYVHNHDCTNVRWRTGLEVSATIRQVGLTGDFRVVLSLEEADISNCFEALVKSNPELALRLACKTQAEATIALCIGNKRSDNPV